MLISIVTVALLENGVAILEKVVIGLVVNSWVGKISDGLAGRSPKLEEERRREEEQRRLEEQRREEQQRKQQEKDSEDGESDAWVFGLIIFPFAMLGLMYFFATLEEQSPELVVPMMILVAILIIVVIVVVIALVLRYKAKVKEAEARKEEAKATERILNTPLEKLGENDAFEGLDDLEEKYAEAAGVEPSKKKSGAAHSPSKGAGRCSRCGTPLEYKGQAFCQTCGARFVATVHVSKQPDAPEQPDVAKQPEEEPPRSTPAGPAPQMPDATLNSQDINSVQYSCGQSLDSDTN